MEIQAIRLTQRQKVAQLLEQRGPGIAGRIVDLLLMVLILLSVLAIVLESVKSIRLSHAESLANFNTMVVIIFTFEHAMRIWTAPDDPQYGSGISPWRSRLRYMVSPLALIDAIAIVPFYLALLGIIGDGNLLVLRSVRLLRILKLTRYSTSFTVLITVIRDNARALAAGIFLLNIVMLLAAVGMYIFEHEAQPVAFSSIPAAMWWAFATLTTVGYGDVVPITPVGRVFGACITVVGVGMVALPTAILASAFSERLRLRAQRYQQEVRAALEDGVICKDESDSLRDLRRDLELGDELAAEITAATPLRSRMRTRSTDVVTKQETICCPHCEQKFKPDELGWRHKKTGNAQFAK